MALMTLQQLQVFSAVAEHLNYTRAAESLSLTQPAVTFHIRSLERLLQLRLVETQGHRVHLTAAGEYLYRRATGVLNSVDMIERHMRQFSDVRMGTLKVGATLTIGNYVMPSLLTQFHRAYPGIKLSLDISNTAQMEHALLTRELDLALVEWHIASPEIEVLPFATDELVIAVPTGHPLAEYEEVEAEALVDEPFVLRELGSGTRALALESLGPLAERINVVLNLSRAEAIKHAVMAGLGITIISRSAIQEEVAHNQLVALRLAGRRMEREFSMAHLRAHIHSPAAHAFLEQLRAVFPKLKR